MPANEAEVQTEQPPTVSCHQLFGTGNGFTGRKLRLLRQDEFRHRIAVCGDNAGDDQQQGPQQDVEALKKPGRSHRLPVGKISKQNIKGRIFLIYHPQIKPRVPNANDAAKNKVGHSKHNGNQDKINSASNQERAQLRSQSFAGRINILSCKFQTGACTRSIDMELDLRSIRTDTAQEHCNQTSCNRKQPFPSQGFSCNTAKISRVFHLALLSVCTLPIGTGH